MASLNSDFIERYQLIFQKDPQSKVFAPLAEAYRRLGLYEQAIEVCQQGLRHHPQFTSGHVALGKTLFEMGRLQEAIEHLTIVVDLAPENLLAQSLLAEAYLKTRQPKPALRAFKMVLFLNPQDENARKQVQKLESLSADEYEEDLFQMEKLPETVRHLLNKDTLEFKEPDHPASPLHPLPQSSISTPYEKQRSLERVLSLVDAFIVRNDMDRALEILNEASQLMGKHPELEKRHHVINRRNPDYFHHVQLVKDTEETIEKIDDSSKKQMTQLEQLLSKIENRKKTF